MLGDWLEKLQPGLAKSLGLAVMTNEARSLSHYNRSIRAFAVSARVVLRTYAARLRRQALLTNGASLIGQMLQIAVARGIPIWTEAPLEDLIVEDGRVVGVRTVRNGCPVLVRARQGVLLAAGGFAHNPEMREQYGGDQPNRAKWSIANPGDTGEALQAAMRIGAKTDLMDEAWWLPSPRTGRFGQSTLDQARQRPRTIYVDAAGKRFVNESNSYMEVGKAMYARDKTSRAVPCWLIFDDRYRKRYAHQRSSPGRFPRKLLESGMLKQAWTLEDLAQMCGIDPAGLSETVERFNQNAAQGIDPDYGRGESAYNRALGDPNHKVHPCLGPIDEAPVLRGPGRAGRHRHLRRPRHQRARAGGRPGRPADRGPVRHRQRHRHRHGPPLPRTRREHRQHHGLRLRRGTPRRTRATHPHRDETQVSVTPSRRTVIAWVGHFCAAAMTLSSGRGRGIDDERDASRRPGRRRPAPRTRSSPSPCTRRGRSRLRGPWSDRRLSDEGEVRT